MKQKKAFDKVVENGGNISRAMIDAGYSENTAKTPQKLTESTGWQELMETYLPDKELAQKHKQFLNSEKEEIGIKALDLGYKLKGSYAPDKSMNINLNVKTIDPTDPEVLKAMEIIQNKMENESTS